MLAFLRELARAARAGARGASSPSWRPSPAGSSTPGTSTFYSERLQQSRFAVSQEELRPYFPLPRVLDGLFEVAERLFGVRIQRAQRRAGVAPGRALLRHARRRDGEPLGGFYLDPYARAQQAQRRLDGRLRRPQATSASGTALPVAYLVCNFAAARGRSARRC